MNTLLIVEDDIIQQQAIKKFLSKEYNVIIASTGREGVQKAIQYIPDMIIMDIYLPDITGIMASEELKKNHKTSEIPILFSSSEYHLIKDKQNFAFLAKPYSSEQLLSYTRKLC